MDDRPDHRAEHHDADPHTEPEGPHVHLVGVLRGGGHPQRQVPAIAGIGIGAGHTAGEVDRAQDIADGRGRGGVAG